MGQKVNPIGFRLGISNEWNSRWYAERKEFVSQLGTDTEIRRYLRSRLAQAAVSRIEILRRGNQCEVTLHTARPGMVIGKRGEEIAALEKALAGRLKGSEVNLHIQEIRKPELDATLVAQGIAEQLERRIMFRRAMRRAVTSAMRTGALGVKVRVSGRLNGAEIARNEWYHEGRVPLHTLRADIDFGQAVAKTTYGTIGVKVWIFKGELIDPILAPAEAEPVTP
ncbi:MAG: 30S ribosomal protein S3 [Gammaproteobacteria bacterium]|uniref:30S ribosomal protein S3 n=1 Tax=mine drainage metagenome TaxID=410659 RepID=T1C000_9ZZZZ